MPVFKEGKCEKQAIKAYLAEVLPSLEKEYDGDPIDAATIVFCKAVKRLNEKSNFLDEPKSTFKIGDKATFIDHETGAKIEAEIKIIINSPAGVHLDIADDWGGQYIMSERDLLERVRLFND